MSCFTHILPAKAEKEKTNYSHRKDCDMKYIWENPQIIQENKQDGHVIALPHKTAESATERKDSPF